MLAVGWSGRRIILMFFAPMVTTDVGAGLGVLLVQPDGRRTAVHRRRAGLDRLAAALAVADVVLVRVHAHQSALLLEARHHPLARLEAVETGEALPRRLGPARRGR